MAAPINIHSREFWTNYVTTAQYDAGKALGRVPEPAVLQRAEEAHRVDRSYRPVIINYSPWNFDLSSRVVHQYAPAPSGAERREQNEEDRAATARLVGSIAVVVGSFLAFYTYKKYSAQKETLAYTQELRTQVRDDVREGRWHMINVNLVADPAVEDIVSLVERQVNIDTLNAARIQNYAIAAITFLAGGILLAIGGFAAASACITLGQITIVASLAIAAANMAWHWDDNTTINRHYEWIAGRPGQVGGAERILQNLPRVFDENMQKLNAVNNNPPRYESIFPNIYQEFHYAAPSAPDAPSASSATPTDALPVYTPA